MKCRVYGEQESMVVRCNIYGKEERMIQGVAQFNKSEMLYNFNLTDSFDFDRFKWLKLSESWFNLLTD